MTRNTLALLWAFLLVALAASVACGGDDAAGGDGVITTPSGTKASPTQAPESSPAETQEAPAPPVPELDEAAAPLGEGTVTAPVYPGLTYSIDPLGLPVLAGIHLPPCEQFVFAFGWQVTVPYPADGVDVYFQIQREAGPVRIAEGPSGTVQTGCDTVEIVNAGQGFISIDLHYVIGGVVQP